ncbi:hypothetical protein Tco_0990121 [Tanacetum coccineum]|uniref:Uncharacterized protein n=1 Tax=Tanacetum coccineum TaxID=301880 RepID=A0ABQ5EW01_9ASTR
MRLQNSLIKKTEAEDYQVHEEVSSLMSVEWEDIQATIEDDEELALRIQVEEREKYSEAEKARLLVDLINQRKRHFAQQRTKERRNKHSQKKNAIHKLNKRLTVKLCRKKNNPYGSSHTVRSVKETFFDELKICLKATMKRVKNLTPMESVVDMNKQFLR